MLNQAPKSGFDTAAMLVLHDEDQVRPLQISVGQRVPRIGTSARRSDTKTFAGEYLFGCWTLPLIAATDEQKIGAVTHNECLPYRETRGDHAWDSGIQAA